MTMGEYSTQYVGTIESIVNCGIEYGQDDVGRALDNHQERKMVLDAQMETHFKNAKGMFERGMRVLKKQIPEAELRVVEIKDGLRMVIDFIVSDKFGNSCRASLFNMGYFQAYDAGGGGGGCPHPWVIDTAGQSEEDAIKNIIGYVSRTMSRNFTISNRPKACQLQIG